ncbi:hypothetical protein QBC32DRAFT_337837 [Pseudoneurospora amorphoporcata]|uniref:Uncharacterized protein n=1 Tax=Pseudoneurospora amorphoporcata TaxID=241081 RepID=A0AAN6NXI8_9PEZI|nr:hypothetical protein QBC32DRAFT_337837 [Pseudoneurospora amorphoporcata]
MWFSPVIITCSSYLFTSAQQMQTTSSSYTTPAASRCGLGTFPSIYMTTRLQQRTSSSSSSSSSPFACYCSPPMPMPMSSGSDCGSPVGPISTPPHYFSPTYPYNSSK